MCVQLPGIDKASVQLIYNHSRAVLGSQVSYPRNLFGAIHNTGRIVGIGEEKRTCPRLERLLQLTKVESGFIRSGEIIHRHWHDDTAKKLDDFAVGKVVGADDGHSVAGLYGCSQGEEQSSLRTGRDDQFVRAGHRSPGERRQPFRHQSAQIGVSPVLRIRLSATAMYAGHKFLEGVGDWGEGIDIHVTM